MFKHKFISFFIFTFIGLIYFLPLFANEVKAVNASFLFNPETKTIQNGTEFTLDLMIDTGGESVGGGGAKIIFDPKKIQVTKIIPGSVFADYPTATFDNQSGKVNISGIISSPDQQFNGNGIFATLRLVAIDVGITKMNFEYTPGETKDSNIAITHEPWDILSMVNVITLTVEKGTGSTIVSVSPPANSAFDQSSSTPATINKVSLVQQIINKFNALFSNKTSQKIDPYGPITRQAPNNNPNQYLAATNINKSGLSYAMIAILGTVLVVLILIIVSKLIKKSKKKSDDSKPPTVFNGGY